MSFDISLLGSSALSERRLTEQLLSCNEMTAEYGLLLTPQQAQALAVSRTEALRQTGRVELGESILKKLILVFRDSPYLYPRSYSDTIGELTEIFFSYRNETEDRLSDDELLEYMKRSFDGACQGSLELLSGRALEDLLDSLGRSSTFGAEREDENDEY